MCRCDICKRRSRVVTIISRKVACMTCLAAMLGGAKVFVRGEPGNVRVILNDDRELVFGHVETPEAVVRPPDRFVPNDESPPPPRVDGRTKWAREAKASQLAGV